jgi:hypothetical protein
MHVHQATPLQRHLHPIHFQWPTHVLAHLPSSRATMLLAHAFSTPTNITEFGHISSCCICWNNSIAFHDCLHFTCPNILAVQVTTFGNGILLNTLQATSQGLSHFAYMSTKLHPNKDIRLTTSSMNDMFHEQAYLSSRALKPAHTLITWTKVN